jgi:enamine deaminase RidA (YjgF/YER057c/UK114 family)
VERFVSPGMHVACVRRTGIEEIFITATREGHESPQAMFDHVGRVLKRHSAHPVSQEVFGVPCHGAGEPALRAALGRPAWPVTWVEDNSENVNGVGGTQVWAVAGAPVVPFEIGDGVAACVFEDDVARYGHIGGMVPPDAGASPHDQAKALLDRMQETLCGLGMDFRQVVRTWFYNRDILDWYGAFNKARTSFFDELSLFHGLVPASTGIGGRNPAGAALTAHALALSPKGNCVHAAAVPSPLQCPALEYGSAFSRALEVDTPGCRRLIVSGTASIAPGGATEFVDDLDAQIVRTMEVVEAILQSRGMQWDDVTRAIAYFKDGCQTEAFRRYCEARDLTDLPALCVHQDICRDDLLFEIEADAVAIG